MAVLEIDVERRKRRATSPSRCGGRIARRSAPGGQRETATADRREFEFSGAATPAKAAEAVARIGEGIRAGVLSLAIGDDEITVLPGGALSLAIEAIAKKRRNRIEIVVSWKRRRRKTARAGD